MDWFLAELVRRANEGGLKIGVTLCVGGAIVSGSLIGGRDYFEGIAEHAAAATGDAATAERARAFFRSPAAMYPHGWGDAGEPPAEEEPLAYIHLADARFFMATGHPLPGTHGVLWRGRLAAVEGFVLGAFEPE
jgi:hypothetical protein